MSSQRELVVLVHGLAASQAVMKRLEWRLQRSGYETLNWGYTSVRGDIQSQSRALQDKLLELNGDPGLQRFHLVPHSMGSILARAALASTEFNRLGRIVMLCPPHRGSRVAAGLSRVLGPICKPLAQLSDRADSFVNNLPEPVGYEIGIIAAARDRVVSVESTHLSRQADHIVINSGHTTMLFRRDVAELVDSFLRQGRFSRPCLQAALGTR